MLKQTFQKYKTQFIMGLAIAFLLAAVKVSMTVLAADLPPELKPCTTNFPRLGILAKVQDQGTTYYLLRSDSKAEDYVEPLITVRDRLCFIQNPRVNGNDVPLTMIPRAIAVKLRVESYKKIFKDSGGKGQFEKDFAIAAKASKKPLLIPSYSLEALQVLGVKVPANVKGVDSVPAIGEVEHDRD